MIGARLVSKDEVEHHLRELGFVPTEHTTMTGRFWRRADGTHVQVPFSVGGFYPDALLTDLVRHVGAIPRRPIQ